jgi:gluconate 2-dehydrogenase gamma chain
VTPTDRRAFLVQLVEATSAVSIFGLAGCAKPKVKPTAVGTPGLVLSAEQWATVAAVQDQLLPSAAGSPGATTVNATGFLDAWLAHPASLPNVERSVKWGAGALERSVTKRSGKTFVSLSFDDRRDALSRFAKQRGGSGWMRNMMRYTLEAFLCEPVHGGNPDEVAWKWLGYTPGFPRRTLPGEPRPRPPLKPGESKIRSTS